MFTWSSRKNRIIDNLTTIVQYKNSLLDVKDKEIENLKDMIHNRDKLIGVQEQQLESARRINAEHQKLNGQLQTRLTDLENNIELLINNLSNTKKKQIGL